MLAATGGNTAGAEAHFTAALERNHALGAPLLVAEVECDYARLLLSRSAPGDRERAGELAAAALQAARDAGVDGLAARASDLQG